MNLAVGRRYRLRNGSLVKVTGTFFVHWRDAKSKKNCMLELYSGQLVGHVGERISWQPNGRYSPLEHDHELDIVAEEKRRRRAK